MLKYTCTLLFVTWSNISSNAAESTYEHLDSLAQKLSHLTPEGLLDVDSNVPDIIKIINKHKKYEENGSRNYQIHGRLPKVEVNSRVKNKDTILVKNINKNKFHGIISKNPNVRVYFMRNPEVIEEYYKRNLKEKRNPYGPASDEASHRENLLRRYGMDYENKRSFSPFRENQIENLSYENKLFLRMQPAELVKEIQRENTVSDEIEYDWGVTKKLSWTNIGSSSVLSEENAENSPNKNKKDPIEIFSSHNENDIEKEVLTTNKYIIKQNENRENDKSEPNAQALRDNEYKNEKSVEKIGFTNIRNEETTKEYKNINSSKEHHLSEKDDEYLDDIDGITTKKPNDKSQDETFISKESSTNKSDRDYDDSTEQGDERHLSQ